VVRREDRLSDTRQRPQWTLSRDDALKLLEELAASGKKMGEFAESKGMSSSRLGWWRTKFARERAKVMAGLGGRSLSFRCWSIGRQAGPRCPRRAT